MTHLCAAIACTVQVPLHYVMCKLTRQLEELKAEQTEEVG